MSQTHRYEQQFLDALQSIFVGAKVDGESGYINLMRIKATYFEKGVLPKLKESIDAACKPFEPSFREEMFDKLYDFFRRYFSESGSIYFRHTAASEGIYERVYTDDRAVMLFWKTHMLYYVKTDRLFNSMEVAVDGERFYFDVADMELKRANEKRELIYQFQRRERDGNTYAAREHGSAALKNLFGEADTFSFAKSPFAVQDCLWVAGLDDESDNLVLDFFAGSGTTAHAVMNLNRAAGGSRKYILVEMGQHFATVILPRVKKIAFSDKWKGGKAVLGNGSQGMSHFAKYFDLEQYEDTLRRARYEDHAAPPSLLANTVEELTRYAFLRDLKLLDAVTVDVPGNQVAVALEQLYPGIDLAETLSCVSGRWIKRLTADAVEFADGSTADLAAPRWEEVKPLLWW